jgi:predicted nucleic acid-binding protein
MKVHLDTDFLVFALSLAGPERRKLTGVAESESSIQMSAIAWYEFARGPRTPEQLAVARGLLMEDGVIPFSEDLAWRAADVFRSLGSPRKRAADIAIGVTAAASDALLLTRNSRDFAGIPNLRLESVSQRRK